MDGKGFDSFTRRFGATQPRRAVVRATIATVAAWLALGPEDSEAGRSACAFRCGGERLQCRQECRRLSSAERHCKRACEVLRDQCHGRCGFTVRKAKGIIREGEAQRIVMGHGLRRGGRGGVANLRGDGS